MSDLPIDPEFLERARSKRNGQVNAYTTLVPVKTALVVIDMQDYFVKEGMPSFTPSAQDIVPNINRLAQTIRDTGGFVVWVQTEAPPDPDDWANRREATSAEGWARRQKLLARDGEGFGIYAPCDVQDSDAIATKLRYSAFIPYPSELDDMLKARGIDTLLIAGVSTSSCCESTARDASMWGYRTIMVADGNADHTEMMHTHTLGKFLLAFGDVQTTDQLVEKLNA